ncbi:MAG: HupE/UreJ family protein [Bacteroidia bacterium]
MSDNAIWFLTGLEHILSFEGYDHILFVSLLAVTFPATEWKKLLGLITAFTIGHSLSLALGVLNIIHVKPAVTELLIALTILLSAVRGFIYRENHPIGGMMMYGIICCFGLIHGMGFSYALKSMLSAGDGLLRPLFLFNTGLEAGQLVIVAAVVLICLLLVRRAKVSFGLIRRSVALISGIFALYLCIERILILTA